MIKSLKKLINSIKEISKGMFTVGKHITHKSITLEYPEKQPELSNKFKGRLALRVAVDGSMLCGACKLCTRVCPCVDLIKVEGAKDENNKLYPVKFEIDIGRCIFCGNCTEVCKTQALVMTKQFELADYDKNHLVLGLDKLLMTPEQSENWLNERGIQED